MMRQIMLIVEAGPFDPLEEAFQKRILELKKAPLTPLLVVAPSAGLLERLQMTLAGRSPAFMNIEFHTFSSLAERIVESGKSLPKPVLSDPLFFDTLVKFIIKSDRPFRGFDDLAIPEGFPMAVRATLRDLMDSGAGADIVEAVKEGFLGRDVDVGSLRQLLHLYRLYLDRLKTLPVLPRLALSKAAVQETPTSDYLKRFEEILFYGFYDATGIQTDLFQTIAKSHPTRFFFPYDAANPAYAFARRFRDTHLQPVIHEEIQLVAPAEAGAQVSDLDSGFRRNDVEILNVSGLRDEASVIAQKLRQAHDEQKIPFSEMMVVARSRERLKHDLPRALEELRVPYYSTIDRQLSDLPVFRILLQALEEKMAADWPAQATWQKHGEQAKAALSTSAHWSYAEAALVQMDVFEYLGKKVSREDYFEILKERLARQSLPRAQETRRGVALLHAEAARGLSCRLVVLAGVEEKAFPRIIREDPFLRDDARMALSNTLGYKVSQKMTAHEEEEILFEILTASAREKIIFTYQRSDDEGAVVGPSPFLRPWIEKQTPVTIPRSYRAKLKELVPAAFSQRDLVTACLLSEQKEAAHYLADSTEGSLPLKPRLEMQEALTSFSKPGPYDGEVGERPFMRLSVTDLEVFGRCPFQYFVTRVLGIDADDRAASPDQVEPKLQGMLVHKFFEMFFKEVTKEGKAAPPDKIPEKVFEKVFQGVFSEQAATGAVVWPVIWQTFLANVKKQLHEILEIDLKELAEQNWQPAYFEVGLRGPLPAPLDGIEWVGKVDRVDLAGGTARVVDYKSGGPAKGGVVLGSLRGRRTQPSLYLLLCEQFFKEQKKPLASASFVYRYLRAPETPEELTWENWNIHQREIFATLGVQLAALKAGHFPIMPSAAADNYCDWCSVLPVCRRGDSLSVYRTSQGVARDLWKLRDKKK